MKSFRKISALLVTVLALALFLAILPISAAAEEFAPDVPADEPTVWIPETETERETEAASWEDTWEETATMEPEEPGWDPYPIATIYSEGVAVPMSDEIYGETVYCYEVMARGEVFSSFMMNFSLPYFVEVRDVVAGQMLLDAWNGVFEYYAMDSTLSVSFSSAWNFSDVTLFYVYFTVRDYSEQTGWVDCCGYQLVNENAELVDATFELGAIEIRPDVIKGDVNGDGVVDLADLLIIQRSIVNPSYDLDELQWRAADIDENGCVDMLDCQYIQGYLVGRIEDLESVGVCKHLNTWSEISELSCTADSYQFIYCYDCGVLVSEKLVEHALGHDFEKGWCVRCGEAEDAWGDVVGPEECKHQFVQDGWEATCTESGYLVERCVTCGYIAFEQTQPAFGHSFVGNYCELCGERDIVIEEGTERVALYKYVSDELELTLFSDATSWYSVTVYTADGYDERMIGEGKWHMAEDGKIFTSVNGTEYVFVEKGGELILA